jgi:hypothetical protein
MSVYDFLIRKLKDDVLDLLKSIFCDSIRFSATGICDEIMWKVLWRQTGRRLYFKHNVSHRFVLLDN